MEKYINSCGHIKYEELEKLSKTIDTPGRFQYCVKDLGDKVELADEYGMDTIVVPKDIFTPERYPEFHLGDKVERIDGTRKGVIYKIYWVTHYSKEPNYFAYYLDYGDRKSTRWTKAEEIRKID